MNIQKKNLQVNGVQLIIPEIMKDERGYVEFLSLTELPFTILQMNEGYSIKRNTLRGMHYQKEPYAQAKLLRCTQGKVYSVALDLRKKSSTYLKWCGAFLDDQQLQYMMIPTGCAHGYVTLQDHTRLQYCVDAYFHAPSAKSIRYDDRDIAIDWPVDMQQVIISEKDQCAPTLEELLNEN